MADKRLPMPTLLPGETLMYVKYFDETPPAHALSSLRAIEQLARAKNYEGIGKAGPIIAAGSLGLHNHQREFSRYKAVFGRDSLRVAMDLIPRYPKLAHATLIRLAELQGVSVNEWREEEPGRIIHEFRDPQVDPVARELTEQRSWGWPYYGSVDSTPEYIRTLIAYCRNEGYTIMKHSYTGRNGKRHTIADALERAVNWICGRLDANKEGLLEFHHAIPGGIENQVWKDSWDSYFHADGTIANHNFGIASVEVQRVAYDALLDAADCYDTHLANPKRANELRTRADHLRRQIFKYFWTDDQEGYFVLGTDRDDNGKLRQLQIRTSNMGHLLHSRLLLGEDPTERKYREAVVRHLFSPQLFSFSGIRTLSTDANRFRPGAYHNGSVWVWDNYLIIQGLEMNGYFGLARFLEHIISEDITSVKRLPEYLRGDTDEAHNLNTRIVEIQDSIYKRVNRLEQPPQDVQAWTAAAMLAIKDDANSNKKHNGHYLHPLEKELLETIRLRSKHWHKVIDEILGVIST